MFITYLGPNLVTVQWGVPYTLHVQKVLGIQAIRFAAQRTIPQNLAQITLDRAPDVEAKSMLLKPIRGIMIHGILIRWQDTQRFKVVCFNLGVFYFDEC